MIPADPYAGLGPATIIRGDALHLPLPDASVDVVCTSPPYFALRSYQDAGEHYSGQLGSEATPDEFVTTLLAATREMVRVLKPSGSIWVNLGDKYDSGTNAARVNGGDRMGDGRLRQSWNTSKGGVERATVGRPKSLIGVPWRYALRCIDELGLILRAEVIWSKPNGLPESVTDRVRRSHETWFHFTLSPRYFAAVDEIRESYSPNKPWGDGSKSGLKIGRATADLRGTTVDQQQTGLGTGASRNEHPLGKLPGSVWEIPTEPLNVPPDLDVDHFAAFPSEWPRRIITGWCPAGVCTACGEGRRPVVDKALRPIHEQANHRKRIDGLEPNGNSRGINADHRVIGASEVTITGYACACPDSTAPTTPGTVLDPFGGTGTVAMVARALGRTGISVDLSGDYSRLARWRVAHSGGEYKARGLERPKTTPLAGQLDLLGGPT